VTNQNEKAIQYGILKRETETNRQLHSAMLERVQEAELASALKSNNVRIVDAAEPPTSPYKPDVSRTGLMGSLLGGILAIGFVLISERANRTLKEPGDLQYYVGLTELGVIPSANVANAGKKLRLPRKVVVSIASDSSGLPAVGEASGKFELITTERKLSIAAESFRATLTSIQFSGNGRGAPSVIVVTSPDPGEGKTTVVTNLAISMAETGQRVLLIDGDTRRPRLHDIFEVENGVGLTSLLREHGREAGELVSWLLAGPIKKTSVEHLDLLPAGQQVAGPVNLFQAKHFSATLAQLRKTYDTILIDSPPMLHIPDARLLGKLADGVVLVFRAGSTTRDTALSAKMRLFEDGVNVIGAVMNDWNPKNGAGNRYGYYSNYSKKHSTYFQDN
jgi:capsular exopolysaccharide synthesis family protein